MDWDPSQYEDRYRKRLLDAIKRKKKGKRITVPEDERQPSPVPDLMAALEESLEAAKGGGQGRRPRRAQPGQLYERAQEADVGPSVDVQG